MSGGTRARRAEGGGAGLLERLKLGEGEAQRWLYETRRDTVQGICARILKDPAEAAEVADGVLTDFLFDAVHRIKSEAAIDAYLKLMATRRAIRRKQRVRSQDEVEEHDLGSEAHLEHAVGNRLLLPKLSRCLEALTPKAREVLRLRYGGELTNERIGDLVGGSKQYIGRLLTQSLELLKGCVEQARQGGQTA